MPRQSKAWWKEYPEEDKKRLVRELGTSEENIKRAAYKDPETGKILIDLLKLHLPVPEDWKDYRAWSLSRDFEIAIQDLRDAETQEQKLQALYALYKTYKPDTKFSKASYNQLIHGVWINQVTKTILTHYDETLCSDQDEDMKACYAKNIFTQMEVCFRSDLKCIRE